MNTEVQISDKIATPACTVTLNFEADATHEQAMHQVDIVCTAINRSELTLQRFRINLGRMMAAIKSRELHKPTYASFEEFKAAIAKKHRLSRPTLGRILQFVTNVPDMEPEEAEKIPLENLTILARIATKAEPRQFAQLRKEAPKLGIVEFRARVVNMALVKPQGRPSASEARRGPVVLKLLVPAALRRRYASERGAETDAKFLARLLDLVKSDHLKAA